MKIKSLSTEILSQKNKRSLRIMKISFFMLFACIVQLIAADLAAQNAIIKLKSPKLSMGQFLNEIENQTDYLVVYSDQEVDIKKEITVSSQSGKVKDLLDEALAQSGVSYLFDSDYIVLKTKSHESKHVNPTQENTKVSGTVLDERNEPIIGASIIILETKNGTVSDLDGRFSLTDIKVGSVLQFSFLGYISQQIKYTGKSSLNIVLKEDAKALEEVVVVGYGVMKKSDITGSVMRADIEAFKAVPNVNIMQSLQGNVPGLNVSAVNTSGGSPDISLRGRNTLSGSTAPLIVLDGIIYSGSMADLNPTDIESIDVLKDVSSKAIYGSQAANGVLLITSKNGRKGRKPEFTYSGYYSFQSPSNILTPMNRAQYIQKTKDAFYQDAYLGPDYILENPDFNPITKIIDPNSKNGLESGTDIDWLDLVTQQGYINNHNLSISGSTESLNYYLSGSYTDQQGYMRGDDYNRISLRANFDNKITNWFNVGFQSFVTSADYSGRPADLRPAYLMPAVNAPYDENGELVEFPHLSVRNPLYGLLIDDFDKRLNLFVKTYAKIDIPYVNGLSYTFNYSTNYRTIRNNQFDKSAQNNKGSGFKNNSINQDYTVDNILNYKKTFAEHHTMELTALYGYQKSWGDGTNASAAIFLNDVLGYNSLESGDVLQRGVSSSAYEEHSLYQMGRAYYGYKSKYLITGTVRRDGFSGFGSNKKFGIFPSVAIAWVASNEAFFANALPAIDNLKLRFSFGKSGNRTIGRYGTLSKISAGYLTNFEDKSAYGQYIANLANNNLGWETTTGLNMGLDFSIFKGRINGTVDYYVDKTEDILFNVNIPYMTGFNSVLSNIGKIRNKGLEISINTVNISTRDFVWKSTINFSTNSNEIVSISGKDADGDGVEDDLIGNSLFIGKARGAIYNYITDGIYQLKDEIPKGYRPGNYIVKDISGPKGVPDGVINAEYDRTIVGYTEPAYRFSVYNKLSYKNINFSFFINSVQGGKNGYYGNITPSSDGAWEGSNLQQLNIVKEWDYWTPNNPRAKFQGLGAVGSVNPTQYQQRSFIRLQDVTLSYNLNSIVSKIGFKNAEINFSCKNLLTITDWIGTDPELGLGLNAGHMPLQKSYSLGINLTF